MNLLPPYDEKQAYDDDHPPGEPLPWRWGLVFIGITCATVWVVIWGVGMW